MFEPAGPVRISGSGTRVALFNYDATSQGALIGFGFAF
jgi:hypothetical protein